ncbi:hypothetical protein Bca4012_015363 [Brassica carinata]
MGRGTLRDPFLDIEKSDTTISDVNKNSSRRNKIAFVLCLSLFLLGGAGFTFARQFTGEESETKSNDKDFVVTSKNGVVAFGSGFMSTSTGVILNNQMADFSIPTEESAAPANYIKANKRPLSSMMPLIITRFMFFLTAVSDLRKDGKPAAADAAPTPAPAPSSMF